MFFKTVEMISLCPDSRSSHLTTGFSHDQWLRNLHLFTSYSWNWQLSFTWGAVKLHVQLFQYYLHCLRPELGKLNAILYKSSAREIVTSSHATRLTWGCMMTFSSTESWCGNPCTICKKASVLQRQQEKLHNHNSYSWMLKGMVSRY